MSLPEMDDRHLMNTIALIERKAKEGFVIQRGGGSSPDDFWYEEYTIQGKEAENYLHLPDYLAELKSRQT